MPRTHLLHLTSELLGNLVDYSDAPEGMTVLSNYIYAVVFVIVAFIVGLYYFRHKEFTEK